MILGAEVQRSALTATFHDFISASEKLQSSYRELQQQVASLRVELEQRNSQLERSAAEAIAARSALQSILNTLPCGVLVIDSVNWNVIWQNPVASSLLEDLLPGGGEPLPEKLTRIVEQLAADTDCEVELESSRNRWISIRKSTVSKDIPSLGTTNLILIIRDVTAQRAVEQKREEGRNLVAMGEVASVLAHEIRNPLASLELFVQLVMDRQIDNECRSWTNHIRAGIRQLSATVSNVLTFYSESELRLSKVELPTLVANTAAFLQPLAEQHGITLIVDVQPGASVKGSAPALQQVITNLCLNSIRHTPRGGTISIRAAKSRMSGRDTSTLIIKDSGRGIAPEDLSKVFAAGFSRGGQHPGLGLAVCRRIVEKHDGNISINSAIGAGTTVFIALPAIA